MVKNEPEDNKYFSIEYDHWTSISKQIDTTINIRSIKNIFTIRCMIIGKFKIEYETGLTISQNLNKQLTYQGLVNNNNVSDGTTTNVSCFKKSKFLDYQIICLRRTLHNAIKSSVQKCQEYLKIKVTNNTRSNSTLIMIEQTMKNYNGIQKLMEADKILAKLYLSSSEREQYDEILQILKGIQIISKAFQSRNSLSGSYLTLP
ncbi:hypothetical protein ABPG74_002841 [Tetrahymena malaccensis]